MNQLISHNHELRELVESAASKTGDERFRTSVDLDSIDAVLRRCLSIEDMREAGSFFTGQKLATETVNQLASAITDESVVLDPTCGAGNLLIECSRKLGVQKLLSSTLRAWGKVLWGYDLHDSFVEATKLRLVVEALNRGTQKDCTVEQAIEFLSNIKAADAMSVTKEDLAEVTHSVMNPPFTSWASPKKHYWKMGKVNSAGIVLDHFVRNLPSGSEISAILPDVLRSGSRYGGFRDFIEENVSATCKIFGRFNRKTDVDVFLLYGKVGLNTVSVDWAPPREFYRPLSDHFDVCVGPLVAYRDPEQGDLFPYVHSKNAPVWETMKVFSEYRRFEGRTVKPPFVVIRRTSSPSDRNRASATIVTGNKRVAVENHMIVIKPKTSTIRDCNRLLKILKSEETNTFLNEQIRLRHLTVGIVKQIPIWQD